MFTIKMSYMDMDNHKKGAMSLTLTGKRKLLGNKKDYIRCNSEAKL